MLDTPYIQPNTGEEFAKLVRLTFVYLDGFNELLLYQLTDFTVDLIEFEITVVCSNLFLLNMSSKIMFASPFSTSLSSFSIKMSSTQSLFSLNVSRKNQM